MAELRECPMDVESKHLKSLLLRDKAKRVLSVTTLNRHLESQKDEE